MSTTSNDATTWRDIAGQLTPAQIEELADYEDTWARRFAPRGGAA